MLRLGERLIAEVEVGWAIVFGSTEAYCNKYASDPIESSLAFSVAPRDSFEPQSKSFFISICHLANGMILH